MEPATPEQKAQGIDYVLSASDNVGNSRVVETIKMSEREPINNKNCQHEQIKLDGHRMGDNVAVGCAKDNCGQGWYIPVSEAEKLGLL